MSKAIAIILAAGSGNRAGGGIPKQFRRLAGQSVISWSAKAFRRHNDIQTVVIVSPPTDSHTGIDLSEIADLVVKGGNTRALSVRNALNALKCPPDTPVLIHDAARPGLSQKMISDLLTALETTDGVAPALPVTDTLKRTEGETLETVDRSSLKRVQTPQCFRYLEIKTALEQADTQITDDLSAMEALSKRIQLITGDASLRKITYEEDFAIMERLLSPRMQKPPRMGTGYDVHAFGSGEYVTLCGVKIPHTHGLVGHSDADIGWHALTDAILGAMALGDIGDHFPPSDPQWKGADSARFLAHANQLANDAGYVIANVDITLICEAPKMKPHRQAMRTRTAEVLAIPLEAVSVKATTTEQLGFEGRREGMAGQAAVVLTPLEKTA